MASRPGSLTKIEIAPRTVIFVGGLVAAVWLLGELWTIAVLVLVALMLVGTLSPLVGALVRRGLGRTSALLVVFFSLLATLSAVLLLTLPSLISQLLAILADAPARRDELVVWLEQQRLLAPLAGPVRDAGVDDLTAAAGHHLLGYSSRILEVIGYGVTAVFLAFYLLADGERAKGALFATAPRAYHARLARILVHLETIVGGYVRGQLITSAGMFAFTFVLLTVLGVPNALSLAVFAGIVDVIPFIGGILATAPALLMAAHDGSGPVIAIAIAMFVYQEIESRVIVPRVYGHVLRLSPVAVMIALLVGGTLMGILGALLALPVAAGLRMIVQELRAEETPAVEPVAPVAPAPAPVAARSVDPTAITVPMVTALAVLQPSPRGDDAADRRASRYGPGPRRRDHRPGSSARPTYRRH
jgi:predicted PurR-regulated permease PerM